MSNILLQKTALGLIPVFESDHEEAKILKNGEVYEAKIKLARNYIFLKKYMAMIKLTFENLPEAFTDKYPTFNDLRYEITILTGNFEWHYPLIGEKYKIAKSIAFDKMSESDFSRLYEKTVDVVIDNFLEGTDKESLINEIVNFL